MNKTLTSRHNIICWVFYAPVIDKYLSITEELVASVPMKWTSAGAGLHQDVRGAAKSRQTDTEGSWTSDGWSAKHDYKEQRCVYVYDQGYEKQKGSRFGSMPLVGTLRKSVCKILQNEECFYPSGFKTR
jgi:hypothetical protein